jgi:hypothetical protein
MLSGVRCGSPGPGIRPFQKVSPTSSTSRRDASIGVTLTLQSPVAFKFARHLQFPEETHQELYRQGLRYDS